MAKLLTLLAVVGFGVLQCREANSIELVLFGALAGFAIGMVRRGPRGRCLVEGVVLGYLAGILSAAFDGLLPLLWALFLSGFS